jgi:N utilization substance protein A
VLEIKIDEDSKEAEVVVPKEQLSLAIGRGGQNARLVAKLTSYKVDIKAND